MDRTDVAWKYVVRIWWAWLWRTVLVNVVVVASMVALLITLGPRVEPGVGQAIVTVAAYAAALLGNRSALWFALSKRYRSFRIVITPEPG